MILTASLVIQCDACQTHGQWPSSGSLQSMTLFKYKLTILTILYQAVYTHLGRREAALKCLQPTFAIFARCGHVPSDKRCRGWKSENTLHLLTTACPDYSLPEYHHSIRCLLILMSLSSNRAFAHPLFMPFSAMVTSLVLRQITSFA